MRIRTILAAAAAPLAIGGVLLTATAASAAPTGPNPHSYTTVGSNDPTQPQVINSTFAGNIDVPKGEYASIQGAEVQGNVTVEGALSATAATFDGNVTVSGPGSQLSLFNNVSHIKGNLSVSGSSGDYSGVGGYMYGKSFGDNAVWPVGNYQDTNGVSQVDGNFSFTGNTGGLDIGGSLHVNGNFTASNNGPYANGLGILNNPGWFSTGGLTADGHVTVS
jgi:hypothetical protein